MNSYINDDDRPIYSLRYHHDVSFWIHLLFWSFLLFMLSVGLISSKNIYSQIIGLFLSGLIVYKKIYYFIKPFKIYFYYDYFIINGIKYLYKDMDFKISKDMGGTQLHGKIYINDEVLENFVIESFLCPGLVRCDFESVFLLFNKLKKGEYSVIEKVQCNDYKNNLFIHSLIILFFILLLAPIIFMAWLRGIPLI